MNGTARPDAADGLATWMNSLAKNLQGREKTIVDEMTDEIARRIEPLDGDPLLLEMLHDSVHGNISTILHVLAHKIPIGNVEPPSAAVEYARRLAQRSISPNSLVRAYHIGQNVLTRKFYDELPSLNLASEDIVAITREFSHFMHSYIDWITLTVFESYEVERRQWLGSKGNVLSATVHSFLSDTASSTRNFERETGYPLDRTHLAVVLWTDEDAASDLYSLERTARRVAARLRSTGPPIVTAVDRSTAWAWIPFGPRRTPVSTDALDGTDTIPPEIRACFGLSAEGAEGFRRSHQQPRSAYAVATVPGSPTGQVVTYGDRGIAVAALFADNMESTRAWVHDVLGDLADTTPSSEALRETLTEFFAAKESHLRTAEKMNLHRNTVRYRVSKALSGPVAQRDRLDLEIALTLCNLLGPAVIEPG